jgi:hypothetical protein
MNLQEAREYQIGGRQFWHIDLGREITPTPQGPIVAYISEYRFRFGGKPYRTRVFEADFITAKNPQARRLELELAQLPKPRGDRRRLAKFRVARHKHKNHPRSA